MGEFETHTMKTSLVCVRDILGRWYVLEDHTAQRFPWTSLLAFTSRSLESSPETLMRKAELVVESRPLRKFTEHIQTRS